MSTTTLPSNDASEPKAAASGAIHAGADLFIALFEAEKAKVTAASMKTLRDMEAHFSEYQQSVQDTIDHYTRRCTDSEAAVHNEQAARAQAVAHSMHAHEQMVAAQEQLAQVQHQLDRIEAFSNLPRDDNPLKLAQEADEATDIEKQPPDAEKKANNLQLIVTLGDIRKELMATQRLLEEKERDCKAVEKERDDLKSATEAEVMNLKDQIFSLQTEVRLLKTSQAENGPNETLADVTMPAADMTRSAGSRVSTGKAPQGVYPNCVSQEIARSSLILSLL